MSVLQRNLFAAVIVAALFLLPVFLLDLEVRFNPQFSLPRSIDQPDAGQEVLYQRCVSERTDQATRQALKAADNPDVQTLMIRMRQKDAMDACRQEFPARRVTVEEPFRLNLLDLKWRSNRAD